MPGSPAPVVDSRFGPHWTAVMQALQSLQQQVAALASGASQTVLTDQWGNAIVILGQLNQVVTIGASMANPAIPPIAGVQVGTGLPNAAGKPNVGIAIQQNLLTGHLTTTAGSKTATIVDGLSGLAVNMVIGAANVTDPSSGVATPALNPALNPPTSVSAISGSTVTLSQNAQESGTGLYCAACNWVSLGDYTYP